MNKKAESQLVVQRIDNGFLVGIPQSYSAPSEAQYAATFEDAVLNLAQRMGEVGFAATVKQAQAMAAAISEVASVAIAPKLLALNAQMNPGVENLVDKPKVNGATVDANDIPF